MTFVWSGGADFNHTFTSTGNPTNWQLDVNTIASGMVSSPGTGAFLYSALVFQLSPGGSGLHGSAQAANTTLLVFADSGGTEYSGLASGNQFSTLPNTNPTGGVAVPLRQFDRYMGSSINGGGTIRLKGYFTTPASITVSGTVVSAIYDSTVTTQDAVLTNGGTSLPPVTGNAFFADLGALLVDHGIGCTAGRRNGGAAVLPDFTGASSWVNLIRRTDGSDMFAGIGDYTGSLPDSSTPFRIDASTPGGTPNLWRWEITRVVHTTPPPPTNRARGWAAVIG